MPVDTSEFFRVKNGLVVGNEDKVVVDGTTGDIVAEGNLVVNGDLTVNGSTTTLNTAELNVEDNAIKLNANQTGTPTLDANIQVERGDEPDVEIRWNETTNKWQFTNNGSAYYDFVQQDTDTIYSLTAEDSIAGRKVIRLTGSDITEDDVGIVAGSNLSISRSNNDLTLAVDSNPTFTTVTANLTGNVTGTVSSLSNHTTTNLAEGTNLYYTTARANTDFDTRLATKTTTDVAEGTNLYYTDTRFDNRLATKTTTNLAEGTNLYYTSTRANTDFDTRLATKSTSNLAEGTNLYFTTQRARDSFTAGTGVSITSGQVAIGQAVATSDSPQFTNLTLTGDLAVNGGDITTTSATFNLVNATATTLNIGGAATAVGIGAATGTTTINNTNLKLAGNIVQASDGNTGLSFVPITSQKPNTNINGNLVKGTIRNSTVESNGGVVAFTSGTGSSLFVGASIDNSNAPATTNRTALAMRNSASTPGNMLLGEASRGTAASPTAVQTTDTLLLLAGNGYNGTAWLIDSVGTNPASIGLNAAENWSGTSNVGTGFNVFLQPTATTFTTTSRSNAIAHTAKAATYRADTWLFATRTVAAGGTNTTQLSMDASGNVTTGANLTVGGDLQVNGSDINASDGQTNITLTSNTLTAFAGDIKINGNDIQNSTGSNNIQLSNTGTRINADVTRFFTSNSNGLSNIQFNPGNAQGSTTGDRLSSFNLFMRRNPAQTLEYPQSGFNNWIQDPSTLTYSANQSGEFLGSLTFSGQYSTTTSLAGNGAAVEFGAKAAENFTATANGGRAVIAVDKIGTTTSYDAVAIDSSNAYIRSNTITFQDNSSSDYLTLNSTKAQFTKPVQLPSYTATALTAVTGAVGWMAAVSDQGGKVAYWDTTNARWSYMHDNSAV